MTRLRSPAQRAPQTTEQAVVLLNRFAEADAEVAALDAQRQAAIATINGAADACIVPLVAEMKDIAKQLKPWWAASIEEMTGGKRKSIELGGCTIGYRVSPPKVVHDEATDGDAVERLRGTAYEGQVVRVSYSLDKPAILKLLEAEAAAADAGIAPIGADAGDEEAKPETLAELGFASKQTEQFFVDRVLPKPVTDVDVITDDQVA